MDKEEAKNTASAAADTVAEAPAVENNEKLREVTGDMFEKLSALLVGELRSSSEDYVLLEQMNALTAKKYSEMAGNAESLTEFMKQLREKCNCVVDAIFRFSYVLLFR